MKRPMTTSTAIISNPSRLNILGDRCLSLHCVTEPSWVVPRLSPDSNSRLAQYPWPEQFFFFTLPPDLLSSTWTSLGVLSPERRSNAAFQLKNTRERKVGDFASLSRCPLFSPIPCWRPCCWSYRLHRHLGRSFKNCLTCLFFCPSSLSLQLQVRGQSWNLGMCSVWVLWQWLSGSECCEGEKKWRREGGRERQTIKRGPKDEQEMA